MTNRELDRAIQQALDGTISEEMGMKLRAILKEDPSARALYYEYAALHQSLIFRLSHFTNIDAARSLADVRIRLRSRRTAKLVTAIAASIVLSGLLTLKMINVTKDSALATFRSAPNTLYTIKSNNPDSTNNGHLDKGAVIKVTQGSLEFTLDNGTQAVVLAPARFSLDSENSLRLHIGTAWFDVSDEGKGFQVQTDELKIIDLGTKFGIVASPTERDEIHVFSGHVEVCRLDDASTENPMTALKSGEARQAGQDNELLEIDPDPERFLSQLPTGNPANLIFNGNFESGTPPRDTDFGELANPALLPGWRFGRDICVTRNSADGTPGHGEGPKNILSSTADIQIGFRNAGPQVEVGTLEDSIWQTFHTIPDQTYRISFEMGGYFSQAGSLEISAKVCDGTNPSGSPITEIQARRSGAGIGDNGYNAPAEFTFTARSQQSTLVFTETSPNTDLCSPAIDNVQVTAVP